MKMIIQRLMTELSSLTQPYNPVDFKRIFTQLPLLEPTQIPLSFKKHVELLVMLNILTENRFSLASNLHNQNLNLVNLNELKILNISIQNSIDELQEQIKLSSETIKTAFQIIMPLLNEFLQKQTTSTSLFTGSTDSKIQKKAVDWYSLHLSKSLRQLDEPAAKLTLLQLKNKIHDLVEELRTHGVACPTENGPDRFKDVLSAGTLLVKQLKEVEPKINELQKKFAEQISATDAELKNQEIDKQLSVISEELEKTQLEISINTLEIKIKERLLEEFRISTNKSNLKLAYQSKIESVLSYINPYSWSAWLHDQKKHDEEQVEYQNSVAFLQLLDKEQELQLRSNQLLKHKKALSVLPARTLSSTDGTIDKLITQAKTLFSECTLLTTPSTLSSSTSASDFYLALLSNIPILKDKIEKKSIALTKLVELASADRQLEQLRTRYELWADKDAQIPNESELTKQVAAIPSHNPLKEVLKQRIGLCKSFLDNTARIELLINQQRDVFASKKGVEAKLNEAILLAPKQDQMKLLSEQLSSLQNDINKTVAQIKLLPLPCDITEEQITKIIELIPTSERPISHKQSEALMEEAIQLDKPIKEIKERPIGLTISTDKIEPVPREAVIETIVNLSLINDSSVVSPKLNKSPTHIPDRPVEQHLSPSAVVLTPTQPLIAEEVKHAPTDRFSAPVSLTSPVHTLQKLGDKIPPANAVTLMSTQVLVTEEVHPIQLDLSAPVSPKVQKSPTHIEQNPIEAPQSCDAINLTQTMPFTTKQTEYPKPHHWHLQIMSLLEQHPPAVKEWYQNIYISCEAYLMKNPTCFKPTYLIRDILFELQKKNDIDIINAYIRLSPNPEIDIRNLLSFKPNLPLTDQSIDEKTDLEEVPSELKPLYVQYIKLRKNHPIEGELLLQAIQSLHMAKHAMILSDSNISSVQVPSLSKDPRYDPLKRHRGFFKIWEAIEDLYRLIIGKIKGLQEHEYTKKHCFFRTKSAQLFEEADLVIQKDLQPICVA